MDLFYTEKAQVASVSMIPRPLRVEVETATGERIAKISAEFRSKIHLRVTLKGK